MPSKLTDLELDEISLVDEPANKAARVVLYKRAEAADKIKEYMDKGMSEDEARARVEREMKARKSAGTPGVTPNGEGETMTVEELAGKLEALEKSLKDVTGERDAAQAKLDAIEKARKADEDTIDFNGEKIAKSAVPAPVLKALADQKAKLEKMEAEAKAERLAKRGKSDLPNLSGSDLAKGRLLDTIEAMGDEGKDLVSALKAADAAVAKAAKEVGFGAVDPGSPLDELDQLAKKYAAEKDVSYAVAYAEVTKSGRGAELFAKRHAN